MHIAFASPCLPHAASPLRALTYGHPYSRVQQQTNFNLLPRTRGCRRSPSLEEEPMTHRGDAVVEQHAAIDPDDPAWAACPQSGVPGQPLDVDIRFCVQRVANVDTVSASATAHIVVMFYWSDTRLVGCPGGGQGAAFKTLDAAARLGKLAGKKRRRLHAARADRQGHGPDQACADCRRDGGQPDRRWSS